MKGNNRNSNFELMRIISMILIIIYHIIYHGQLLQKTTGTSEIILRCIMALTLVHVSSFVLLSGYFQHNKKQKFSKVISLNNSVWFYSILIAIFAYYVIGVRYDKISIFKIIMPINYDQYWFIKEYLILYLISPILNVVIQNSDKSKMKKIIILLFFITSFLPYITDGSFLNVNSGYSLYYFIFLYFVGAYLNIYPMTSNRIYKNYSKQKCKLYFIVIYLMFCFMNVLFYNFGYSLLKCGDLMKYFGQIITYNFLSYNNPLILFAAIYYFVFFEQLNINSNILNKIASLVFGVYLIHENNYIKIDMYKMFGFNKEVYYISIIPRIMAVAFIIFIVCIIIEFIRQLLFKFIYNRKVSGVIRKKYRKYISDLGFNINW